MRPSPNPDDALFWGRLAIVSVSLIAVFFLHFTFLFSETRVAKPVLASIYAVIPIVTLMAFTGLLDEEIQREFYGYAVLPGTFSPSSWHWSTLVF
jgi:hypothetical protein